MPQNANNPASGGIPSRIAILVKKVKRVLERVSQAEEDLDAIVCELVELQVKAGCSISPPVGPKLAPSEVSATRRPRSDPQEPLPTVISMKLVTRADGSAVAQIEARSSIPLPRSVAALLDVLAADGGVTTDHLVGWKSVTEIQAALKERTRQTHSEPAIKELVYRLRRLLEQHGEDRSLVQNNPQLGYRFAVRRRVGPKPESDNL